MKKSNFQFFGALVVLVLLVVAQMTEMGTSVPHGDFALPIAWLAIVIFLSQIFSSLMERMNQPGVLGELLAGVVLANLGMLGVHFFEGASTDKILHFMAEIGVILLLFRAGLHASVEEMMQNSGPSFRVALVGVIVPVIAGFGMSYLFFSGSTIVHLFFGGTMCATSVGITMKIFEDLRATHLKEAKIALGAGIFDDVKGLIVLAIILSLAATGEVSIWSIALIIFKAIGFFLVTIIVGARLAPLFNKLFANLNRQIPMQFAVVIFLCFSLAYLADTLGLAPIIGSFAAGLLLKSVHFSDFDAPEMLHKLRKVVPMLPENEKAKIAELVERETDHSLTSLTDQLGHFFIPIFFVVTGMGIDLAALADIRILAITLLVTAVAVLSKVVAGFVAGKGVNHWIIGFAMAPRGEVGLIFAAIGKSQGIFDDSMYAIVVAVVILTTFIAPPILANLIKRKA